ncbi:hypothetical protein ABZP36_010519 [Zizania latifolia]
MQHRAQPLPTQHRPRWRRRRHLYDPFPPKQPSKKKSRTSPPSQHLTRPYTAHRPLLGRHALITSTSTSPTGQERAPKHAALFSKIAGRWAGDLAAADKRAGRGRWGGSQGGREEEENGEESGGGLQGGEARSVGRGDA